MRHSVEHTTTYQSAIVRVALSCTIFDIFDVEEYRDLEIRVVGNSLCEFMHDMYIWNLQTTRTVAIFRRLYTVFQKKHVTTFFMISWSWTVYLQRFWHIYY